MKIVGIITTALLGWTVALWAIATLFGLRIKFSLSVSRDQKTNEEISSPTLRPLEPEFPTREEMTAIQRDLHHMQAMMCHDQRCPGRFTLKHRCHDLDCKKHPQRKNA